MRTTTGFAGTPRSTAYRDLSPYSSLLNRWVHDLKEPDLVAAASENRQKEEPTSGSSLTGEEARSEEPEEFPLPLIAPLLF